MPASRLTACSSMPPAPGRASSGAAPICAGGARPRILRNSVVLQRELLGNAAGLVKPGGRLVYSTCSLEPEENEEQITLVTGVIPGVQARRPARTPASRRRASLGGEEPWLYLWPHRQGTDGFFVCRMERQEQATPDTVDLPTEPVRDADVIVEVVDIREEFQ